MKFFQKTSVAVIFTVLMIAAALFIGLSPVLKSDKPAETAQTAVPEQTISQTPAEEQTSNTAGDETISDEYIRDDAGLFTRSGEKAIRDYNDKDLPQNRQPYRHSDDGRHRRKDAGKLHGQRV